MKKHFLFLLSCMATLASYAQETATIGDVKYLLDEGEATILVQPSTLAGAITVPATVTHNGVEYTVNRMMDEAFKGTKITSIVLPNTLTKMGSKAFLNCSSLKSVTLPEGITSLGESYFQNCSNLTEISLPAGITEIGDYCFNNCSSLSTIALPNGLESLGKSCFESCSNLTSIELPNTLTTLGEYCFSSSGLVSIELPNSITSMGSSCFYDCEKLTSVSLPTRLSFLPSYCFYECIKLESVTIPNNYTVLASYCFKNCSKLSSVVLSNSLEKIGNNCFDDCNNLSSIKLPSSLTSLGYNSFNTCGLVAITLPSSITKIGNYCFEGNSSLIKVTCQWEVLNNLEVGSGVFNGIYSNAELYVPNGTYDLYKATSPWSDFKYIYEKGGGGTPSVKCATPTISYANKALVYGCATDGAQYHYAITDDDVMSNGFSEDGNVALAAAYTIRVYASADGYLKSDVAEAKLYFIDASMEETAISAAKQRGLLVETTDNTVQISGLADGETVSLYNTAGVLLSTTKAVAGCANLPAQNANGVVIAKIGRNSLKIALK